MPSTPSIPGHSHLYQVSSSAIAVNPQLAVPQLPELNGIFAKVNVLMPLLSNHLTMFFDKLNVGRKTLKSIVTKTLAYSYVAVAILTNNV